MATKERVKTYRVLRDGMRVGDSVRNFGDFMPEARELPTFRTLLNTNLVEEVWVDEEEFDAWKKSQAKRDKALANPVYEEEATEGDKTPKNTKKRVAAKKTAKKTVVKKKGKSSGERLTEQRV